MMRQSSTGIQFVDAELTINNMKAYIIYCRSRSRQTVEITTTPPVWMVT